MYSESKIGGDGQSRGLGPFVSMKVGVKNVVQTQLGACEIEKND